MTNATGSHSTARPPSRDAAFVVHLTDAADGSGDQAHGRVEHVTTGRATCFHSAAELMRFMREVLATVGDGPKGSSS